MKETPFIFLKDRKYVPVLGLILRT